MQAEGLIAHRPFEFGQRRQRCHRVDHDQCPLGPSARAGGDARVRDDHGSDVGVRVIDASPAYIQTYADGVPTDNLLWLPRVLRAKRFQTGE